jgi:Uma2 family endonuclease
MMVFQAPSAPDSIATWLDFVERPENASRSFELINGEIIEKMPGTVYNSWLALRIALFIIKFCEAAKELHYLSTGDGTFDINGNVVAPDVAFKRTPPSKTYPDLDPPLWAVEVISDNDKAKDIRDKRQIYLDAGILYWEVYPDLKRMDVYAPGQAMRSVGPDDIVDGGGVLPGFTLAAVEVWAA